jgi:hypothetical protein
MAVLLTVIIPGFTVFQFRVAERRCTMASTGTALARPSGIPRPTPMVLKHVASRSRSPSRSLYGMI